MKKTNILIAGIGGQGTIRASHIIAKSAIKDNLNARVGETYGAAMRGGPVASHVRIGEKVHSPLNSRNGAETLLALEPVEGLRNAHKFLAKNGLFLTNTETVVPYDVNIGSAEYPSISEIRESLTEFGVDFECFDATSLAKEAGSVRTMNVVMIGALHSLGVLPTGKSTLQKTIQESVPENAQEINVKAFKLGLSVL